ncbi:MAG: DNA polymerase IV [Candidatus Omnitrophota bacterium]|nr:DNA polymerase IV [Candidatus Omnitrophota bacterium]
MSANINKTPDFVMLSSYPIAIAHIDCDAFFTSCESARDPKLKNLPIVTGKERGIVSCPSYEAKARGIKRGMRLTEAGKICPELIVLPSDYELYSIYSSRMFTIIRRFTPDVEEYSIDEAFCDLTGLRRLYRASYPAIARRIKEAMEEDLGITVSVGVSLSKTLAKLASKTDKPDGFTCIPGYKLHEFLKDMPLEKVCGFGPNTAALLNKSGVRTVLDYIKKPQDFAQKLLGKIGRELWCELRGMPVYRLVTEAKERYLTISKTKTFSPASDNKEFVKGQLMRNMESAFIKLRRHNLSARNLTAYLRRTDFSHCAMEGRLTRHSSSTLDFTQLCSRLFEHVFEDGAAYRSSGVILSDIMDEGADSRDLFEDPVRIENLKNISIAIDKVNSYYGKHTLHLASSNIVNEKGNHPRNCLAWRKQNLLKGESFRQRLNIPLLKMRNLGNQGT